MKRTKFNNTVPNEHLALIRTISNRMAVVAHYDAEDLFSEACLAYCIVRKKYDTKKGAKLSTFLWVSINNHLKDYLAKQDRILTRAQELLEYNAEHNYGSFIDTITRRIIAFPVPLGELKSPMRKHADKFFCGIFRII